MKFLRVLAVALVTLTLSGGLMAAPAQAVPATGPVTNNDPAKGYWFFTPEGDVIPSRNARFYGEPMGLTLAAPIVGMAASPSGNGYWLVGADGGVFAYGDARFFGSTSGQRLNKPVVDIARTPTGNGYWLVASDGGVFAFGDARFFGSTSGQRLNKPVVSIASTLSGRGYWLLASDGGVFAFGDARFFGSGVNTGKVFTRIDTQMGDGYILTDEGVTQYYFPARVTSS